MFDYIKPITSMSLPLSIVQDELFRRFSNHEHNFSIKHVKQVMFQLVEIVEQLTGEEMKCTKVAILHDGWTHAGTHYLGIFASYIRRKVIWENNKNICINEHVMPLLSMSPLRKIDVCEDDSDAATDFGAQTRVENINEVFQFYEVDAEEWVSCIIQDNCSTNNSISSLMNVPHVGCLSHKLALQVKKMFAEDALLRVILESFQQTMTACRMKLKCRASLRNMTDLATMVPCKTRWSGQYLMLQRFNRIRNEIAAVANEQDSHVAIDVRPVFVKRCEHYEKMLRDIHDATVMLQKEGLNLSDCRFALSSLTEEIELQKNGKESPFYRFKLVESYISVDNAAHSLFESGVLKILRGNTESLTDSEIRACIKLRKTCTIQKKTGSRRELSKQRLRDESLESAENLFKSPMITSI